MAREDFVAGDVIAPGALFRQRSLPPNFLASFFRVLILEVISEIEFLFPGKESEFRVEGVYSDIYDLLTGLV